MAQVPPLLLRLAVLLLVWLRPPLARYSPPRPSVSTQLGFPLAAQAHLVLLALQRPLGALRPSLQAQSLVYPFPQNGYSR